MKIIPPRTENGMICIGFVSYDEKIWDLFKYMPRFFGNYNKKIEKVIKKDIAKLSLEETKQYLTYIYGKERIIEGFIKSAIDNGILLELLKHFLEVC